MIRRTNIRSLVAAAGAGALASVLLPAAVPTASAATCSDVEVVFARGTTEAPGPGFVGQDFADTLRGQVGGKSVNVYPVVYPATDDWPTAVIGVNDATNHINQIAAQCPDTSIVLGGFSQGAAVAQLVTADAAAVPPNSFAYGTTTPLSPEVAGRVDAVALFGKTNARFLSLIGQPVVPVGAAFVSKTIDQCAVNDPICSGGIDFAAHNAYPANGMVAQAASFAAARV